MPYLAMNASSGSGSVAQKNALGRRKEKMPDLDPFYQKGDKKMPESETNSRLHQVEFSNSREKLRLKSRSRSANSKIKLKKNPLNSKIINFKKEKEDEDFTAKPTYKIVHYEAPNYIDERPALQNEGIGDSKVQTYTSVHQRDIHHPKLHPQHCIIHCSSNNFNIPVPQNSVESNAPEMVNPQSSLNLNINS